MGYQAKFTVAALRMSPMMLKDAGWQDAKLWRFAARTPVPSLANDPTAAAATR
jgi:hypothetical protein